MSLQRLTALRALLANQPTPLTAFIVPTSDAHNSEYIAPVDARREWLTGFTGSAGTAVVAADHALVWTDGRYYTQFAKQTDPTIWTLMKQSLPETPTMEKWLTSHLAKGSIVGADPRLMSREEWTPLQMALTNAKIQLVAVTKNLVDEVRLQLEGKLPARPHEDIIPLPVAYTGKTAGQKIQELLDKMLEKKASALVITALDEVAYVLNLRGSDIKYNPIFFSYLVITPHQNTLFWGDGQLPSAVTAQLASEGATVVGRPYDDIIGFLTGMAKELSKSGDGDHTVWLSSDSSEAVHRAASGLGLLAAPLSLLSEVSPVALAKLVKNNVELKVN